MNHDLDALNARFSLPGLSFLNAADGFPVAEVSNAHGQACIALQGAQVMTWQPHGGEPVIWLSRVAKLAPGKSVRGGVPVCWPWFGPHVSDADKPAHGYARTVPWQVIDAKTLQGGETQLTFALAEGETTRKLWPHDTPLHARITVGRTLEVELVTRNAGQVPVTIGEALHTYFQVSDVGQIAVEGLAGCTYADKVDNCARKVQQEAITFRGEVDRVYLDTTSDCVIADPGYRRRIRVAKEGSRSTVIWNPWIEKAAKMGDLGDDGYRRMVCVESANAMDNIVTIAPGGEHRMKVCYSVEML